MDGQRDLEPYWGATAPRKWQLTFTAYEIRATGWDGSGSPLEERIGCPVDVYARRWSGARGWLFRPPAKAASGRL
jgi:hypothetical protein